MDFFKIDEHALIKIVNHKKELKSAADFFSAYINGVSGHNIRPKGKIDNAINLSLENISEIGEERYHLKVSESGIKIIANTTKMEH